MKVKVLELFCGIGGMHFALKESGMPYEIKACVDINTVTNSIYRHNFPQDNLLQRQIESLKHNELTALDIDAVTMSPPCQPFTRAGLMKDNEDNRTDAFFSLLKEMEKMVNPPLYIFVENVKGFENSSTRDTLVSFFHSVGYNYREFLLTPLQFGIPNSRLRYYCMARHKSLPDFCFTGQSGSEIITVVPEPALHHIPEYVPNLVELIALLSDSCLETVQEATRQIDAIETISTLSEYLEVDEEQLETYRLGDKEMEHFQGLDIRNKESRNSCCFTKRYGRYYVGAGSFLQCGSELTSDEQPVLRYFTPREVANIMCFPSTFEFPESISRRQRYRALGNSLNVHVVANLIKILLSNPDS